MSELSTDQLVGEYACSGRGGSTICVVGDHIIIFGGANREQVHFSDLWTFQIAVLNSIVCDGSSSVNGLKLVIRN